MKKISWIDIGGGERWKTFHRSRRHLCASSYYAALLADVSSSKR